MDNMDLVAILTVIGAVQVPVYFMLRRLSKDVDGLRDKIEGLRDKIGETAEGLRGEMKEEFGKQDVKIEGLRGEIKDTNKRFDNLWINFDKKLEKLGDKIGNLRDLLYKLELKVVKQKAAPEVSEAKNQAEREQEVVARV